MSDGADLVDGRDPVDTGALEAAKAAAESRVDLACDGMGGAAREGRVLRRALEAAAERITALEAECARLRRGRDEARCDFARLKAAALAAIHDGSDLARLVERARPHLSDVDHALLAWASGLVVLRAEAGL